MKSLTIDSKIVKYPNELDPDVRVGLKTSGFDAPEVTLNSYGLPGADGLKVSGLWYDGRVIDVTGDVNAKDEATFIEYRQRVRGLVRASRSLIGVPSPKLVEFTTYSGESYFVYGFISKMNFITKNRYEGTFHFIITCEDYRIYGRDSFTTTPITRLTGGGFILPVVFPIVSTEGVGGQVSVTNEGDTEVEPVIHIIGSATNPYILNKNTGQYFQVNQVTGPGDHLIIDMKNKLILLNGTSILNAKALGSSWFSLDPGQTFIGYSTGSTSDTGTMYLEGNPAFLGAS